ncbi:MAG: Hsp70 family protein, partial [Chloroflexota bacterium]
TAEKTVRDHGDKIPADVKSDIESKAEALKTALQGQDVAPIKSAMQELTDAVQKAGSAVYGQPGTEGEAGGPGGQGGPGEPPPDDTVEGEFREI